MVLRILALLLATATAAAAQDQSTAPIDRSTLLAAERDRKATEVTPPDRSLVERALSWYDNQYVLPKIVHAIGYHVPEDFIVTFDVSRLAVAPGAKIRTNSGDRRPIQLSDVSQWLADTPRTADGRIRAVASRYVSGKAVCQFRYTGTRPDDANDIYPLERRRELRAMRVFAAWLNHDDARSINSIDTYVEENRRRYVRHYPQDFGSNLGSGSTSAQQPRGGYEYLIEGDKIAKGLFTFGMWTRDWTRVQYPDSPSLGNIEAEYFQPWKWKTDNLAASERLVGTEVALSGARVSIPDPAWGTRDEAGARYAIVSITTVHPDVPHWSRPVIVTIRNRGGNIDVVGIDRPTQIEGAHALL